MNWRTFTRQHKEWIAHNFPDTPAYRPAMGMAEEIGELFEAAYDVSCAAPDFAPNGYARMKDAIGDTLVYMDHYCMLKGIRLERVIDEANARLANGISDDVWPIHGPMDAALLLGAAIGKLLHGQLKSEQKIRGPQRKVIADALVNIVLRLRTFCAKYQWDIVALLEETWAEVYKRDWKTNKTTGIV